MNPIQISKMENDGLSYSCYNYCNIFHEKTCTYDHQNVSYLLYLKNRKTYLLITNIIIDIQSSLGIIGEHD